MAETNIKEILPSILKKYSLLSEMKGKEKTDLIEVEVGTIYNSVLFTLCTIIISNKEKLESFFKYLEEKAVVESNPIELEKINTLLELKPLINAFDNIEKMEVITKTDSFNVEEFTGII